MKIWKALISMVTAVLAVGLLASPVAAQSYEGTSIEEGIFFVPADLEGGSPVDFSVNGLLPNSEITFTLLTTDGDVVADIDVVEVAGAFVLRTDAAGNFNGEVVLPDNIADGLYTLEVDGFFLDGSAFETSVVLSVGSVAATPAAGATTGAAAASNELALTGSSSLSAAMNGVIIVLLGVVLVFVATRLRSGDAQKVS